MVSHSVVIVLLVLIILLLCHCRFLAGHDNDVSLVFILFRLLWLVGSGLTGGVFAPAMDRYGFSGDIPVLLGGLGVRVVGEETKNNRYAIIYRYIIDIESGLFQT